MATLDEEEEFEHTLFVCREVRVYKVPPMNSGGVRSGEWKVADEIWRGRLRVSAQGKKCSILLEDPKDGTLFAECPYHAGRRAASITDATDSSRNFVLRLDDGKGHHAFVGMGFQERNDAFDFNVALTSHDRQVAAASAAPSIGTGGRTSSEAAPQPHIDRRLKEGETIHVGGIRKGSSKPSTANTPVALTPGLFAPPPGRNGAATPSSAVPELKPIQPPASQQPQPPLPQTQQGFEDWATF